MSCLFPIKCHRVSDGTISFKYTPQCIGDFYVPCGQCGECRLARARSWATRCVHESKNWKLSSFITLTYKETPPHNSLCPDDTRNFIRRLRQKIGSDFKYFLCGEYGEKGDRPHYHAIIFGHDFGLSEATRPDADLSLAMPELNNSSARKSKQLDEIWSLGHTSVGELTFDSAAYVAQYSMKKVNGPGAAKHYGKRLPEFMRHSQNAIGKQYALTYSHEIISNNSVISNQQQQPIPNYYLKLYDKQKLDLTELKQKREEFSQTHTIEKSYIRAQKLDQKFTYKISKADSFRIKYAKDRYFNDLITHKEKP